MLLLLMFLLTLVCLGYHKTVISIIVFILVTIVWLTGSLVGIGFTHLLEDTRMLSDWQPPELLVTRLTEWGNQFDSQTKMQLAIAFLIPAFIADLWIWSFHLAFLSGHFVAALVQIWTIWIIYKWADVFYIGWSRSNNFKNKIAAEE